VIRILITGSRTWTDYAWIEAELDQAAVGLDDPNITLVSGACPRGADRICEEIAAARGWTVERHLADWSTHGKAAGFIRNQAMVDLGADVCLVFVRAASRGATHCGQAAERAGIPTRWNEAL
jgi:hypothetical protein